MATKKKALIENISNNGSTLSSDSNLMVTLVAQMKYLVNTLHHLSYIIQCKILSSDKDIQVQSTDITYKNVSDAFNFMHYFFDILAFLEWEVQYLRNDNRGTYFKKTIPACDKQYDTYIFRYDKKLNAETYYTKENRLVNITKDNKKLRTEFLNLYDEIDTKFQDAKQQFNNYLSFIKHYNLHYEVVKEKNFYVLFDNRRRLFPNDNFIRLYESPTVYLKNFVKEFKTNYNSYDKLEYSTTRNSLKKTDKHILELTNTIIDQSVSGSIVTYKSLDLSSNDFVNYLCTSRNSFTVTSAMVEQVNHERSHEFFIVLFMSLHVVTLLDEGRLFFNFLPLDLLTLFVGPKVIFISFRYILDLLRALANISKEIIYFIK
jgi:hypothetical protein